MDQHMARFVNVQCEREENACFLVVRCSVSYVSIRSSLLIVSFKYSTSLLIAKIYLFYQLLREVYKESCCNCGFIYFSL